MSDVLIALLTALPAILLALGTLVVSVRNSKKADVLAVVSDQTHALVNSSMGVQLKLHAGVTQRMAALTKDPADQAAADVAEKMLKEHDAKQAVADKVTAEPGAL